MSTKILLIEPPVEENITEKQFYKHPLPPLWALSLASYLNEKKLGFNVNILDGQLLSLKKILKKIEQLGPEIVGFSPKAASYINTLVLAKKSKLLGAKVILGGHHATGLKKEILQNRGPHSKNYCIDGIIQQDGEKAFYQYISGYPLAKIVNLVYQTEQGIRENPIRLLRPDQFPSLDRNLVNLEEYFRYYRGNLQYSRPLNIYSSKGCSWRKYPRKGCIFCPHMEKGVRLRSPVRVRQEIDDLVEGHRVNLIRECSDDFLNDRKWFNSFFKASVSKKLVPIHISARADKITPKVVSIFRKINISGVSLGIESVNEQSLTTMHKGVTAQVNKRAIDLLLRNNIATKIFFVLAAPGETKSSLEKTGDFIEDLLKTKTKRLVIKVNLLVPLPGSLAWDMLVRKIRKSYYDQDILDFQQARIDWLNHFCYINMEDVLKFEQKLRQGISKTGKSRVHLQLGIKKPF